MGLDQHFFRHPVPDPLPPKWSDEARDTMDEYLYERGTPFLMEAVSYGASGALPGDFNGTPFTVTRKQLGQALLYMDVPDRDDPPSAARARMLLTMLLLVYPDEQFVYLASW